MLDMVEKTIFNGRYWDFVNVDMLILADVEVYSCNIEKVSGRFKVCNFLHFSCDNL